MNILSLNVCGVGIGKKMKKVMQLCNRNGVSFLGLQDTHLIDIDLFKVKSMWGNYSFDFVSSSPQGGLGIRRNIINLGCCFF